MERRVRERSRREDAELLLNAIAYVDAVHKDMMAENTAPPSGVTGRVVGAIIADAALSDYVDTWASARGGLEANLAQTRPVIDAIYQRVSDLLRRTGDQDRRAGA
jgi:hypothetical protein